jgi:DNA-directed RNA polymerase II subunit RPB2
MEEAAVWKIIDTYFQNDAQALVKHHIDSYDQFYEEQIYRMFAEMNPVRLQVDYDDDPNVQDFRSNCLMYFGGKDGKRVYFGKPVIHDPDQPHIMYPNECRLRDLTYAMTIHYDVEIEYTRILKEGDIPTQVDDQGFAIHDVGLKEKAEPGKILKNQYTPSEMAILMKHTNEHAHGNKPIKMLLPNIFLGRFPIMVQSASCVLKGMPREMRFAMGECRNDKGGYFIINGKEKVIIPQEAFGDNILNVYKDKHDQYLYSADLRSVSENVSKPVRQMSIRIMAPTVKQPRLNIGVFIPNAGNKPIPLFIVFRALGILPDKEIMSFITLNEMPQEAFVPYLEACVHDASIVQTQYDAVYFISRLVKGRSITRTLRVLADYFLPHVGEMNYLEKAYHLGYIVHRLLSVATGAEPETDRDSYKSKRLTLIGPLLKDLFREYYAQQQRHVQKYFETRYEFGKDTYSDLTKLIYDEYEKAFATRIVEEGFRKAFKGNWGAYSHTKKVGIVQDLNILSNNGIINHLRKTNLPMDASVKLVGPRVLHGSQWGIIDPIDTPDGGNVGLHKHMAMMAHVSSTMSREPLIAWLKSHLSLKTLAEATPVRLGRLTKVFVNGYWVGCLADPIGAIRIIKTYRRHGLIPVMTSVMFDRARNAITLCCDGGRICRPIMYRGDDEKFAFQRKEWSTIEATMTDPKQMSVLWTKMITGFHDKKRPQYNAFDEHYYEWNELYDIPKEGNVQHSQALLEFLDTQETEGSLIAMHYEEVTPTSRHTHCELHPSTTYGVMCNMINFLEHNPASRNSFSCGQSKQACSLYSTNYQLRMDKSAVVLNNGQLPLVKSRYLQYINHEEHPYGENAIVAIMCYTGYNVEDAVLINESALQRGLFRTTYYTTYSAHEEREIRNNVITSDKTFANVPEMEEEVQGMKPDHDYSHLNEYGLVPEETLVHDKLILIGQTSMVESGSTRRVDCSKGPKKGQLGVVDKSFITDSDEGKRIAKVRIREERIPTLGDKFASRAGQKGTVGMVIPEANMPFTRTGVRPDMIINPHALPSRMTLGQMIECIVGKACCMEGTAGECTAFYNRENKLGMFGELLSKHRFHSTGDEILYDGMTGRQTEASVFIGPTYYMRLKHMVKDKINYRATGPLTKLTRQPVHGRANDGGLRIGEMERDAVISHGMASFLQESMMDRADAYQMAICNKTGGIAIYNANKDLMLSPSADGPLQYTGSLERESGNIEVTQLSKHGRSFSLVRVPYSLKLLMQELQAINVHMHIITDDTASQFDNMNFSQNINLCLHSPETSAQETIETMIKKLKEDITKKVEESPIVFPTPNNAPSTEDVVSLTPAEINATLSSESPQFNPYGTPTSPDGPPPGYKATTPDGPPPGYVSTSPQYNPYSQDASPPYPPRSETSPPYPPSSETSPPYPPSSETSPPYPPRSETGSQLGGTGSLALGDQVLYNGDVKPLRVWSVTRIGPQTFTIDTEDLEHLSVEESRKVVEPKDVRRPTVYDIKPLEKTYTLPVMPEEPSAFQPVYTPPVATHEDKPTVNIKIFNQGGVDNSQAETSTETPVSGEPGEIAIPTNTGEIPPIQSAPIDFSKHLTIVKKDDP